MTSYREVPELLEEYMDRCGVCERWITAKEFRDFFQLDRRMTSTISGFFRRIHHRPYFTCPYIVLRIKKTREYTPQPHEVNHYYVVRRMGSPRSRQGDHPAGRDLLQVSAPQTIDPAPYGTMCPASRDGHRGLPDPASLCYMNKYS